MNENDSPTVTAPDDGKTRVFSETSTQRDELRDRILASESQEVQAITEALGRLNVKESRGISEFQQRDPTNPTRLVLNPPADNEISTADYMTAFEKYQLWLGGQSPKVKATLGTEYANLLAKKIRISAALQEKLGLHERNIRLVEAEKKVAAAKRDAVLEARIKAEVEARGGGHTSREKFILEGIVRRRAGAL